MRSAAPWIAAGILATMFGSGGSAATGTRGPVSDTVYGCKVGDSATNHRIRIRLTVTMKSPEAVGVDVRPGRLSMKIVMPRSILADLSDQPVDSLSATITPKVGAAFEADEGESPEPRVLAWRQVRSPAKSPVAASGEVRLTAATWTAGQRGDAFKAAVPGVATFTASALTMILTPPAGGAKTATCTPETETVQAKVVFRGPKTGEDCPPNPAATVLNPDFEVPEVPPTAVPGPIPPAMGCAKLKGFSNIKKLDAGVSVESLSAVKSLSGFRWFVPRDPPPGTVPWQRQDYVGENQPVRATGTVLTFGFVPTTTTVELTQVGVANVHLIDSSTSDGSDDLAVAVNARVTMRVLKASVNGRPIDVGPRCGTARPIDLKLRGGEMYDPPYQDNLLVGGVLRGLVEIPPFAGCGVGEDISRLLTASVSGKANEIQVNQGALCGTAGAPSAQCPPEVTINGKKAGSRKG
ncbi:hypothetical protein ACFWY5_19660 [Nonomuraea sp. NPDC059007]|uniref:hypothetical protein n=1 Tax=Nonomuraea sp. NPDC059007 TaxID=3346692 RepID=UPI00369CE8F3